MTSVLDLDSALARPTISEIFWIFAPMAKMVSCVYTQLGIWSNWLGELSHPEFPHYMKWENSFDWMRKFTKTQLKEIKWSIGALFFNLKPCLKINSSVILRTMVVWCEANFWVQSSIFHICPWFAFLWINIIGEDRESLSLSLFGFDLFLLLLCCENQFKIASFAWSSLVLQIIQVQMKISDRFCVRCYCIHWIIIRCHWLHCSIHWCIVIAVTKMIKKWEHNENGQKMVSIKYVKYGKPPANYEEIRREFAKPDVYEDLGLSLHHERGKFFNVIQITDEFENCILSSSKSISLILQNTEETSRFF